MRVRADSHKLAHGSAVGRQILIRVDRKHAALVGALVTEGIEGDNLQGTPLSLVPVFATKILAAAARSRYDWPDGTITVRLARLEGLAGFHYLVLYEWHGAADDWLTTDERHAVLETVRALASALTARRGAKRLVRRVVEDRLQRWDPATSLQDARWIRRLKRRVASEDRLAATPLRPIPARLRALLSRQNKQR